MIIDQSGHPIEYSPAEYTYQEGISRSQWRLINEAPIEFSQWIHRKEEVPVLIEEKRSGKELTNCWVGLPVVRFLRYKNGLLLQVIFAGLMRRRFYLPTIKTIVKSGCFP